LKESRSLSNLILDRFPREDMSLLHTATFDTTMLYRVILGEFANDWDAARCQILELAKKNPKREGCACIAGCEKNQCQCVKQHVACTSECRCYGCGNKYGTNESSPQNSSLHLYSERICVLPKNMLAWLCKENGVDHKGNKKVLVHRLINKLDHNQEIPLGSNFESDEDDQQSMYDNSVTRLECEPIAFER